MRCTGAARWLRENLPETAAAMPARVREHVGACPDCQAVWARQQRLAGVLARTLDAPSPASALKAGVMAAVKGRARPARGWRAVPAVAVAGLLVAFLVHGHSGPALAPMTSDDFHSAGYVQQHAMTVAGDPFMDAAALHAIGTLSMREELRQNGDLR